MQPQSHFIAFNDIKFKHFSYLLADSSVYIVSRIRAPVAQEWTRSTSSMRASFVDLLRESASQSEVATRLRLNVCWCTSEVCKYKKRIHNDGHDDSLFYKMKHPHCSPSLEKIFPTLMLLHKHDRIQ